MAIDKSLRRKGRLSRSRNVLTRAERIEQMKTEEKWITGTSPLGIPKTRVLKVSTGKKKKKTKEEGAEEKKDVKKAPAKKSAAKKAAAKKPKTESDESSDSDD